MQTSPAALSPPLDTPREENPLSYDPGPLARRWEAVGWSALLVLLLCPLLPGVTALYNIAGGIGLAWLLITRLGPRGRPSAPCLDRPLTWALRLFALGVTLAVLLSPVRAPEGAAGIAFLDAATAAWGTLRAAVAAGLILRLAQSTPRRAALLLTLLVAVTALAFWAPLDHWLRAGFTPTARMHSLHRVVGTKGNPGRFAAALYLASVSLWALLLCPTLRGSSGTRTWRWAGGLVGVATIAVLWLRQDLLNMGPPSGWLPGAGNDRAAWNGSFHLLALCSALMAVASWWLLRAPGWRRGIGLGLAFLCLLLAIVPTDTRLPLALFLATGGLGCVLLGSSRTRRVGLLAILLVAGLSVAVLAQRADALTNLDSTRQRLHVWTGAARLWREAPILGHGYGQEAWRRAWRERFGDSYYTRVPLWESETPVLGDLKADGTPWTVSYIHDPRHAHNLALQILVERGLLGALLFAMLWAATLNALIRRARRRAPLGDESPSAIGEEVSRAEGATEESHALATLGTIFLILTLAHGLLEYPVRGSLETWFWAIPALGLVTNKELSTPAAPDASASISRQT